MITKDGSYAYELQFGTQPIATGPAESRRGAIALWRVGPGGALTALNSQVADVGVGGADIALSGDSRYLYARNTLVGTLTAFRVESDGSSSRGSSRENAIGAMSDRADKEKKMRLTFTACAMAMAFGATRLATSAQAVPLASAFPAVAASNVDSGFTQVAMSKKQHMMMMKKKHMMHHHHGMHHAM